MIVLCAGALCRAAAAGVAERHTLTGAEQAAVNAFVTRFGNLRMATPADCRCDSAIQKMRHGSGRAAIGDYAPNVVVGDFNGDGKPDVAVLLFSTEPYIYAPGVLVIFNGPIEPRTHPAFVRGDLPVIERGLFVSPKARNRLSFGRFTGSGCSYVPFRQGYQEDCSAPAVTH